jgi:hypothetical protein
VAGGEPREGRGLVGDSDRGPRIDRPGLAAALAVRRVHGGTLIVSKLDRLSRNTALLLILRDSRMNLIAADLPEANLVRPTWPHTTELCGEGAHSLRALAVGLNARGIPAPRGGLWTAAQVRAVLFAGAA